MPASRNLRARFCALVLALGALTLTASPPARAQTQSTSIAVLPVVVHSMESNEYLRAGVADMLASRLGQYAGLGVIRVDDPARAAADDAAARAAGREAGAEWVLYGSFTQFGEGASLDLRCLRVDGADAAARDPRSIFVQSGQVEQIIPQLSNLAERVAAHVHAGPRAGQDASSDVSANSAAISALRQRLETLEAQRVPAPAVPVERAPEAPVPTPTAEAAAPANEDIVGQALEALRGEGEAAEASATP